jgi:SMI1-KNR4 cell-wall
MMMKFRHTEPPLRPSELEDFERTCGLTLPQEFRDLYLQYNGGQPERDRFTDSNGTCVVHEFLPIKYGPPRLTLEATLQRVKSLLPDNLVPFAVDPGGAFFCFSTRAGDYGQIYFCLMEDRAGVTSRAEFLAPSLTAFLASLHSKP